MAPSTASLATPPSATVVGTLRVRAAQHPERVALVSPGRSLTYSELWQRVLAVAALFTEQGLEAGDRVLMAADTSGPVFVVAYLAAHLIGAIAVPVDPAAPAARHSEIARRSRPRLGVGVEPRDFSTLSAKEIEEAPANRDDISDPHPDSIADLLFTTGTSGAPKGVLLSHAGVTAAASHINAVLGNGEDDREVVPLPLSHSFGLGRLRCNLLAGGTLILAEGFKLPGEIFSALRKQVATGLVGVPAGFAVLLRFGQRGLGSFADQLRYVEIGSAPMPLEHKRELAALLPRTRLFMHYGLTEASRSAFIEFHSNHERLDTVGVASPGVEIEIRDGEGKPCAPDTIGKLWIRGRHVARSYWEDDARTSAVFVDGWVKTDDLAERSADGFVRLHGREDDMVNVGGFNVAPEEVERALEEHPAVAEAACVGMSDPRGITGQVVRACLVATPGQDAPSDDDLRRWTAERLETYKVPVRYDWLPSLPRTPSGKLQRALLRDGTADTSSKPS